MNPTFRSFLTRTTSVTLLSAALVAAGLATTFAPGTAQAAAPMVKTQAPGYYRLMLGDVEVTALSDGTADLPVEKLLHAPVAKTQAALAHVHLGTPVETSFNAFLINTGSRLVLVDTGAGGFFGPTVGKLLENLQAAGYQPGQVDDIVITHAHPDHVGGLVAQGAVVFPNATVHVDRHDTDFWLSKDKQAAAPAEAKGFFDVARTALAPYADAGRLKGFDAGTEVVPGVRSHAAYGHTPGHTVFEVVGGGQKLLLIGDLIHVGAVQLGRPEVTIGFDTDPKQARAARLAAFAQAAKEGTIIAASHLQFPGLGRLQKAGKGFQWVPVNYQRSR